MSEFSLSAMNRLIHRAAKIRVSHSAAVELDAILEEYAARVSREAIRSAKHRGAKTVDKRDVRAAVSRTRLQTR